MNLRVDLKIDEHYIPDMNQRLMVYRQMASALRDDELDRVLAEVRGSVRAAAGFGAESG